MGFWPFGGSKRHKSSKSEEKVREVGYESRSTPTPDNMGRSEKQAHGAAQRSSRANSHRPQGDQPKKLSAGGGSSGVRPSASRDPIMSSPVDQPTKARTEAFDSRTSSRQAGMYQQNVKSNSSLGPENFTAVRPIPTLRAKRSDYNPILPRRKSSKRKAEDQAREREVRNMSSPIPIPKRPLTFSEGILARETKNMPGDLNHKFERPTSEISLPLPETFAEIETRSPASSFRVSSLAVLSPRPTIRYDSNPRSGASFRSQLQTRLSVQQAVVEEDLSSSQQRIDSLADGLDSSGLRQLMERDRKRRDRKREEDKNKLQRKLQRRADRQREEEAKGIQNGDPGPSTPPRQAQQHQILTSPELPSSPPTSGDGDTEMPDSSPLSTKAEVIAPPTSNPFADPSALRNEQSKDPIRNPFEDENDVEEMQDPFADGTSKDFRPEPTLPVRSPLREVKNEASSSVYRAASPPALSSPNAADDGDLPQALPLVREVTPDLSDSTRQGRRSSDQPVSSWTNFFRRGKRQPSVTERSSEFTNTSRESFPRQQPPPIVPPRDWRRSGPLQRTQSKFREDLPELPMSPPDSRVQSPEAESMYQGAFVPPATSSVDGRSLATSASIPTLDRSKQEQRLSQQRSIDLQSADVSGTGPALSQSLASVDSEGSWLSGKPPKRTSAHMGHPLRQSQSSLKAQIPGAFADDEGQGVADDEFLSRLTPAPEDTRRASTGSAIRKASSTVIDLQREQDRDPGTQPEVPPLPANLQDEKWHGSVGKQPMVIKQARAAKSKEGLLKDYEDDGEDSEEDGDSADTGTPDVEYHSSPIMRATSVEYGKGRGHSRVISAGSARLLDIRRASVQSESKPAVDSTARASQEAIVTPGEKDQP